MQKLMPACKAKILSILPRPLLHGAAVLSEGVSSVRHEFFLTPKVHPRFFLPTSRSKPPATGFDKPDWFDWLSVKTSQIQIQI